MNKDQIKELATKATEAALTAYLLRPDKEGNAGRNFNRGFGKTRVQQLAVDAAFAVLSSALEEKVSDPVDASLVPVAAEQAA